MKNKPTITDPSARKINPDSPKMRLIRLVVGTVIITLSIIMFNLTSKWWQEADARDAAEKAKIEAVKADTTSFINANHTD